MIFFTKTLYFTLHSVPYLLLTFHNSHVTSNPIMLSSKTSTTITGVNCTNSQSCHPNSICYRGQCRCRLGLEWCPNSQKCLLKSCRANFECYPLYENSMCETGSGCICSFGFELEETSQQCRFSGFKHTFNNSFLFFGLLTSVLILLWFMFPGLIVALKRKSKIKKKVKLSKLQTSLSASSNTDNDNARPPAAPPNTPTPLSGEESTNNEVHLITTEVSFDDQTVEETPSNTLESESNLQHFYETMSQETLPVEHQLNDAERILFEISRDLLHELNNQIETEVQVHSSNSPPVQQKLDTSFSSVISSGNLSRLNFSTPNFQPSNLSSTNNQSRLTSSFTRMNSQNSNNSNVSSTSSSVSCIDSLYHPPPPYTPPDSPSIVRISRARTRTPILNPFIFQNPTDDLNNPDEVITNPFLLSTSPPSGLSQLPPQLLRHPPSRLNSRIFTNSTTNLTSLEERAEEEEEYEVEDYEDDESEYEEEPEVEGPPCQPPPPYFKRCDNLLDTGNLPTPCTSRAAVTSIIEQENLEKVKCQEGVDSEEDTEEDFEDEENDEDNSSFDYTRSLNRSKVALI